MNFEPKTPTHTVDGFHNGRFVVVQPKGAGHRSGIDAMLLASLVPTAFIGRLVDLGAGAGAAGFAVARRCEQSTIVLAEGDALMVEHALATINHPANAWAKARADALLCDVTLTGKQRQAAGLSDHSFDFAIMNPPFNLPHDRTSPDPLKAKAHVMNKGLFEAWLRTASAILRPGGGVAIIARPQSIADILSAMDRRFGALRLVAVQPRANEAAIRILIVGTRGSNAPLRFEPPIILHGPSGSDFLEHADALINGAYGLFDPRIL